MQFKSANDISQQWIKFLVYGHSGVGKTVLAATMPNVLLISAEAGTLSLKSSNLAKVYGDDVEYTADVPIVEVRTIDELLNVGKWLATSDETKQFESVALDSISEIAEIYLRDNLKKVPDPRQAYGKMAQEVMGVIEAFKRLPKHIYFAAKAERSKDSVTGMQLNGPAFPGQQLANDVPYQFDYVFKLDVGQNPETKENYRYLQTQPDNQSKAKSRGGNIEAMEYPHLSMIINKIHNS